MENIWERKYIFRILNVTRDKMARRQISPNYKFTHLHIRHERCTNAPLSQKKREFHFHKILFRAA